MPPIPIIDLFAGPGGLGEGFSALKRNEKPVFKIGVSIEKDPFAHQTLELRAFFRQFPEGDAPVEYYSYLTGRITRKELFAKFPVEAKRAEFEAWHATLGGEGFSSEIVDKRIRTVLDKRNKWVLIGGPPCQAYSLVGRSKIIGEKGIKKYEADHRHFLYREYLRILAVHQPPIFVMENVKGLLSAKVKEERIFDRILEDLRHPLAATKQGKKEDLEFDLYPMVEGTGKVSGIFKPEDFIVRCEEFGIPQARHRIILLGVKSKWKTKPRSLEKSKEKISIEQVIGDLPKLRSGLSKEEDSAEMWRNAVREIANAKWFGNGGITPEVRDAIIAAVSRMRANLHRGKRFLKQTPTLESHAKWFVDLKLKGVCNHETRGHIREDLHRYIFAAVFTKIQGRSPLLEDLPKALLPKHVNVAAALKQTKFNDRFRVQMAGRPSTTVVSHISKDGHYYIHYDPLQCRSLTVREAARLQTFPDNYFFEGPRTQQYHQVGNAVPPLLAHQIAEIVYDLLQ